MTEAERERKLMEHEKELRYLEKKIALAKSEKVVRNTKLTYLEARRLDLVSRLIPLCRSSESCSPKKYGYFAR